MQFVQSYGLRDSLPLGMFSFLAKQPPRAEPAARPHRGSDPLQLRKRPLRRHHGGRHRSARRPISWIFLPGLVDPDRLDLLMPPAAAAASLARSRAWHRRTARAGRSDRLGKSRELDRRQSAGPTAGGFDPNFTSTLIGTAGTVQQSPDIIWRLHPDAGSAPPTLAANRHFQQLPRHQLAEPTGARATDFKDLDTRLIGERPYLPASGNRARSAEPARNSRLSPARSRRGGNPAAAARRLPPCLRDFELDGIERNTFGTVRVFPERSGDRWHACSGRAAPIRKAPHSPTRICQIPAHRARRHPQSRGESRNSR